MTPDTQIADVSDTSFWVAHYRAQETDRPNALFQDRFAKRLVGDHGRNIADSMAKVSRYVEWSVIARTVIIDRFIEQLVKDGVDAVINLGTGLDARPYRMNLPPDLVWVEVDYPNIIAHKNNILETEQPRCKLTRIAVDLANGQERQAFLNQAAPHAKKVLILTEGVIPYLTQAQVRDLSVDLLKQSRFTYWITEYFHPRTYPALKGTVRALKMKNAPFRFYPDDWYGFFKNLGWAAQETRSTGEIATEFNRLPPMPRLAALFYPLLPKRIKEGAGRMVGYTVFKRAH